MKAARILAIDPGTKEIGVAVFEGEELLYYGVKTIKTRNSPQEVLRRVAWVIKQLIADFDPEILAIEKTFIIQKSAALLNVSADEIKATARQAGIKIHEYAPTLVRKQVCGTGKATKKETAKRVAERYPVLSRYLTNRTKWEEMYYANLFDAVALGMVCYLKSADDDLKPAKEDGEEPYLFDSPHLDMTA
jgi:crossover junction endodeoxyribonuclease RuvC